MKDQFNRIVEGDCIEQMQKLPAGSVDLVFADPPFNIGYDYDVYDDRVEHQQYIDWSAKWISAVEKVLKPNGTFWLAIGDEYAAELKLESQKVGFHCRSWVIWYYTFGVNCSRKFTRSHAHLFHFVKDPQNFTFLDSDPNNRVPSARELVYNDKRANPLGRLPDDTWIIPPAGIVGELIPDGEGAWTSSSIAPPSDQRQTFTLRPQDLEQCFQPSEDTWYFPRVAGTFKERAGFHGCQMPEQLLGRIIRTCSNLGDVVLDPFSGSATTVAVAKKLGRKYLAFDLSSDYVQYGTKRLEAIRVGDRLDGSPEPTKSAKKTASRSKATQASKGKAQPKNAVSTNADAEQRYDQIQLEMTLHGVTEAFRITNDGFSVDRVVADPELNAAFVHACQRVGLAGDPRSWNMLLFRLRKAGSLTQIPSEKRTIIDWDKCENYMFASEIAWQSLLNEGSAKSLDEILCDPELAKQFDSFAQSFAPGYSPLEYRWAALKLRKEAKNARSRAAVLSLSEKFPQSHSLEELNACDLPNRPGLYVMSDRESRRNLYAGETSDLQTRLALAKRQLSIWNSISDAIIVQVLPLEHETAGKLAWQSYLVKKYKPTLNCFELGSAN
jgi:DNA modification methylase